MSEIEIWCKVVETKEHGLVLIQKGEEDDNLTIKTTFQCDLGEVSVSINIIQSEDEEAVQHGLFTKCTKVVECTAYINNIKKEMGLA